MALQQMLGRDSSAAVRYAAVCLVRQPDKLLASITPGFFLGRRTALSGITNFHVLALLTMAILAFRHL